MSSPTSSLNLTYPPARRTFKPYRCLYPFCIKQYTSSAALEAHYATHPRSPAPRQQPPALSTSNTSTPASTAPSTPNSVSSPPSSPTTAHRFARMKPARSHTAPAAVSQVHISRPSIAPPASSSSSSARRHHMRSSSSVTATSTSTAECAKERKRDPRTSGTVTRCGRHGDEWLFGGWNVRGVLRDIWG